MNKSALHDIQKTLTIIRNQIDAAGAERIFESIKNVPKFYELENHTAARAIRELAADTDLILVSGL